MSRVIHQIPRTQSTQSDARKLLADGVAVRGDLVVADEQTAGRGRFGRTWISPYGGLYMTLICAPDRLLPLVAGLAVANALRAAGIDAGLKWPNDVLVDHLKIAGVLIEIAEKEALVGIGLNLTQIPLETATCLARYIDSPDRDEWVQRIAREMPALRDPVSILNDYREVCRTLGQRVRVEGLTEGGVLEGIATNIDEQGRLIVETSTGDRALSSGECFHVRPHERGS